VKDAVFVFVDINVADVPTILAACAGAQTWWPDEEAI